MLQCPRSTLNYMIRLETGAIDLIQQVLSRAIKWIGNINNMGDNRYLKLIKKKKLEILHTSETNKVKYNSFSQLKILMRILRIETL